jgi:hypothetical protein
VCVLIVCRGPDWLWVLRDAVVVRGIMARASWEITKIKFWKYEELSNEPNRLLRTKFLKLAHRGLSIISSANRPIGFCWYLMQGLQAYTWSNTLTFVWNIITNKSKSPVKIQRWMDDLFRIFIPHPLPFHLTATTKNVSRVTYYVTHIKSSPLLKAA